jgi:hypothetical protein
MTDLVLSKEFIRDVLKVQPPFEIEWQWNGTTYWLVRLVGTEEWHKVPIEQARSNYIE